MPWDCALRDGEPVPRSERQSVVGSYSENAAPDAVRIPESADVEKENESEGRPTSVANMARGGQRGRFGLIVLTATAIACSGSAAPSDSEPPSPSSTANVSIATAAPGPTTTATTPAQPSTLPSSTAPVSTSDTSEPRLPERIACNTQYRPDADSLAGVEEPTLTADRSDRLEGDTDEVTFSNMVLRLTYVGDAPEGHAVFVFVETSTGEPLVTTLYQIGSPMLADITFAGGHGFTGLQYVYHAGSSLQVFCTAHP